MRISIWTVVAAVSILFLTNGRSFSQEIAQITDIELPATYCLGVVTQQIEKAQERFQSEEKKLASKLPPDDFYLLDIVRSVFRDQAHTLIERRDRFRDYLKVKGFMSGRNIKSIELALRQGTTDATQCFIDIEDPIHKQCTQQCGLKKDANDDYRCDSKCPPSAACTRLKRCLENFLPF